jgi:hypothetical protein
VDTRSSYRDAVPDDPALLTPPPGPAAAAVPPPRPRVSAATLALIGLGGLFAGVTGPLLSTFVR